MRRAFILTAAVLLAWSCTLHADEVVFTNGDRLTGTVKNLVGGKLSVTSLLAGTVTVDWASVATFSTDAPVRLHLKDGTVVNQKVDAAESGRIGIPGSEVLQAQTFAIADIAAINPPAKPKPKWGGNVTAGFTMTRGNSETEMASLDADVSRRGEKDRTTLKAGYLYGKQKDPATGENVKTTDKWFASAKYDYFFSKKWYGFGIGRVERDNVANLDLRALLGAGVGYQWIETDKTKFATEAGVAFKREEFAGAVSAENDFAAHLAYRFEQKFSDQVSFLHDLTYYPAFDEPSDYFLTTQAELRAMLTKSLFASAKVVMNRDSTPAPGAKKTDLLYIVGVGLKLF